MNLKELHEDGFIILEDGRRRFEMDLSAWGNPSVFMDGDQIPSSRIWEHVLSALETGQKMDRPALFAEAERASMYAQHTTSMLLWTLEPSITCDTSIQGNVYWHRDTARRRPLVELFGLVTARINPSSAAIPRHLAELFDAAALEGLYPVAGVDNKYYFSKNPEELYERLHAKPEDWSKIMKMARRPGQFGYTVDLNQLAQEGW